jgi:hypothetical protein
MQAPNSLTRCDWLTTPNVNASFIAFRRSACGTPFHSLRPDLIGDPCNSIERGSCALNRRAIKSRPSSIQCVARSLTETPASTNHFWFGSATLPDSSRYRRCTKENGLPREEGRWNWVSQLGHEDLACRISQHSRPADILEHKPTCGFPYFSVTRYGRERLAATNEIPTRLFGSDLAPAHWGEQQPWPAMRLRRSPLPTSQPAM